MSSSSTSSDGTSRPLWSWRDARSPAERLAGFIPPHESPYGLHSSALQAAETPKMALWVMLGSFVTLALLGVALAVTPWQQTVSGSGAVTAFSPDARPQPVEAQLSARIQQWYVDEGDAVAAGDTIAVLEDISSSFLDDRFVERIAASRTSELRVLQLETERARQTQSQAEQQLRAARARLENASLETATARERFRRAEALYADGLTSLRAFESEQLTLQKTRADSIAAAAEQEAARQEVQSARLDVDGKTNALDARRAELDLRLDNAQERRSAAVVRAPIDGIIARVTRSRVVMSVS
ncbi:MAG: biotin/lipoyl-binding protein [Bacteroidota bacterium]